MIISKLRLHNIVTWDYRKNSTGKTYILPVIGNYVDKNRCFTLRFFLSYLYQQALKKYDLSYLKSHFLGLI